MYLKNSGENCLKERKANNKVFKVSNLACVIFFYFSEERAERNNLFGSNYLCRWFRFAQLAKGKKFRP